MISPNYTPYLGTRIFRNGIIIISIAALTFLIITAAKRGFADVYAYQASAYIDQWALKNINPQQAQWEKAFSVLSQATSLVPQDASYLETMAKLYQWKVFLPNATQQQITDALSKSKFFYQKSIALRPTWPYAWANYALVKQQLNEIDDDYQHAISRASKLGPWEPGVQQILAQATFPSWQQLTKKSQTLVVENFFRASHNNHKPIVQLAKEYKLLPTLCSKLVRNKTINKICLDKNLR